MTRYVLANWKSHKTLDQAEDWFQKFLRVYRADPQVKVIVAPPVVYLAPLWHLLQQHGDVRVSLAVQDLSPFPLGEYTGAVAAAMVRDMVSYAVVGHSERRRYFHETNQDIANKVSEAAAAGITPILCLDSPYAAAQLAALDEENVGDLIIGYGPVQAAGRDMPQSPEKIMEAIEEIQTIAPGKPVLYGGSTNPDNAGSLIRLAGVDGLMVGSASLSPDAFFSICKSCAP